MADDTMFNIGMIVACTTCHGQKVEGEVIAFDYPSKMLAIKAPAASGKPSAQDVRLLNLAFISDVVVIKESTEPPPPLSNLSHQKLNARMKANKEEKLRQVNYIGIGVTPMAQKLFLSITKTIEEVRWEGQNINVLEQVTIYPPYLSENCKATKEGAALNHVRKLVDKFHRDQTKESSPASSSASSS